MQDDHYTNIDMDDADAPMDDGAPQEETSMEEQQTRSGARLLVKKDDEVVQDFPIDSMPVTIGRKSGNQIVLEDRNISRKHAEIVESEGQILIRDLGSTGGTKVNGQTVVERDIHTGDVITIGDYSLHFDSGNPDDERTVFDSEETVMEDGTALDEDRTKFYEEPEAVLKIVKSDSLQEDIRLGEGSKVFGRDEEADVTVDDKRISRKHCEIALVGSEFIIKDLGSSNGTFVNGQKISEKTLAQGDRIQVGSTVMEFRMEQIGAPKARSGARILVRGVLYLAGLAVVAYGVYYAVTHLKSGGQGPVIMQTLWEYATRESVGVTPGLGDVNGDGFINLVAADDGGTLYGLDGRQGGLIWNSDFNTRGGTILSSPKLVDINRQDGDLDVVIGTSTRGVLAMDGGTMRPIWWGRAGSVVASTPAVADINADNTPDVVVGTMDGRVICYDGRQGGPVWTVETQSPVEASPVMADLNSDGVADVIVGSTNNRLYTLDGRTGRTIWVHAGTEHPSSAASADFNGDRIPDVAFMTSSSVFVLEGAKGALLYQWNMPPSARPSDNDPFLPLPPALADLDGDRVPDLIVSTPGGHVYALSTAASNTYLWDYGVHPARKTSAALFDFNGDGVMDVAVGDDRGMLILIDGTSGHELNTLKVGGVISGSPVIGDFTAAGTACLAVGTGDGRIVAVQTQSRIEKGAIAWRCWGGDLRSCGYGR